MSENSINLDIEEKPVEIFEEEIESLNEIRRGNTSSEDMCLKILECINNPYEISQTELDRNNNFVFKNKKRRNSQLPKRKATRINTRFYRQASRLYGSPIPSKKSIMSREEIVKLTDDSCKFQLESESFRTTDAQLRMKQFSAMKDDSSWQNSEVNELVFGNNKSKETISIMKNFENDQYSFISKSQSPAKRKRNRMNFNREITNYQPKLFGLEALSPTSNKQSLETVSLNFAMMNSDSLVDWDTSAINEFNEEEEILILNRRIQLKRKKSLKFIKDSS